jgi:hypothetical protein
MERYNIVLVFYTNFVVYVHSRNDLSQVNRYSRQNVKQQLIDDCIDKNDRESFLEEIFGDEGLINADDIVCFEINI